MNKKRIFAALAALALVLLSSCATAEEPRVGAMGFFPVRDIPVTSLAELQSDSFEIMGTVEGHGSVSIRNTYNGDSRGYGTLEMLDVDRMYFGIDYMNLENPYAVSLANAINDLNKNARAMGAAFVVFPSYTVELVDCNVVTTASAVAVKLVEQVQPSAAAESSQADATIGMEVEAVTE